MISFICVPSGDLPFLIRKVRESTAFVKGNVTMSSLICGKCSNSQISESKSTHNILCNFRELLWFWKEYYTRRGRDRLSIEFSSRIPFYHWKILVGMYVDCYEYMLLSYWHRNIVLWWWFRLRPSQFKCIPSTKSLRLSIENLYFIKHSCAAILARKCTNYLC